MSGAGEAFADVVHVEVFVARLALDFFGGVLGDDAEFCLRLGEGDFDVEPLPVFGRLRRRFRGCRGRRRGMRWVRFAFCVPPVGG